MEAELLKYMHEEGLELLLAMRHNVKNGFKPYRLLIYESPDTRAFNIPETEIEGNTLADIIQEIPSIEKHTNNTEVIDAVNKAWRRVIGEIKAEQERIGG